MKPISQYEIKQWPETFDPKKVDRFALEMGSHGRYVIDVNRFEGASGAIYAIVSVDECDPLISNPADMAIHLIEKHLWDENKAERWLRDQVQEKAFSEEI